MLLQNAARSQKKIVLSEGSDPRVVQAAIDARKQGIARIVLVGPEQDNRVWMSGLCSMGVIFEDP